MKSLAEQSLDKAKEALQEYNDACVRGEEPHFPQWAQDYLNLHAGDKK